MMVSALYSKDGRFLGVLIPAADLKGPAVSVAGTAEEWAAATLPETSEPVLVKLEGFLGQEDLRKSTS